MKHHAMQAHTVLPGLHASTAVCVAVLGTTLTARRSATVSRASILISPNFSAGGRQARESAGMLSLHCWPHTRLLR